MHQATKKCARCDDNCPRVEFNLEISAHADYLAALVDKPLNHGLEQV